MKAVFPSSILACSLLLAFSGGNVWGDNNTPAVEAHVDSTVAANKTENGPPLTLKQAYALAIAQNKRIRSIEESIPEARADIRTAKMIPNPALMTDLGFAEKTYRVAGIQQTLESPGQRHFRVRVAKDVLEITKANAAQTVHEVLSDVRKHYIAWITALSKAEFQRHNLTYFQMLADIAAASHKAPTENLDVDQTEMLVLQAQADAIQAAYEVKAERRQLALLLETEEFSAPQISAFQEWPHMDLPNEQTLTQYALTHRADLRSNAYAMKAEKDRTSLLKRQRIPNLNVSLGYDLIRTSSSASISNVFTMGQIALPIFDRQQGNIARSAAAQKRLAFEREDMIHEVTLAIEGNYDKATDQERRWQLFHDKLLPLADRVDEEAARDYRTGRIAINDALGTHQNTQSVRLDAVQTFIDYQTALNDLESSANGALHVGGTGEPAADEDPAENGGSSGNGASSP